MYPRWKERHYSQIKPPCLPFKNQFFQDKLSCKQKIPKKLDILQYIENNVIIMKYKQDPYQSISVLQMFSERHPRVGTGRVEEGHALQFSCFKTKFDGPFPAQVGGYRNVPCFGLNGDAPPYCPSAKAADGSWTPRQMIPV